MSTSEYSTPSTVRVNSVFARGAKAKNPSEFSISSGAKLLLLASQTDLNLVSQNFNQYGRNMNPQVINDSMAHEPHLSVISKGKPVGCIISTPGQTTALPHDGFVVYNKNGILSKIFFETDALYIESEDGSSDRIFLSNVHQSGVITLPKPHDGYFALGIRMSQGMNWYYFIPNQYKQYFQKFLNSQRKTNSFMS
jgi:hypothetical protein